jgi:hypothetical protein
MKASANEVALRIRRRATKTQTTTSRTVSASNKARTDIGIKQKLSKPGIWSRTAHTNHTRTMEPTGHRSQASHRSDDGDKFSAGGVEAIIANSSAASVAGALVSISVNCGKPAPPTPGNSGHQGVRLARDGAARQERDARGKGDALVTTNSV